MSVITSQGLESSDVYFVSPFPSAVLKAPSLLFFSRCLVPPPFVDLSHVPHDCHKDPITDKTRESTYYPCHSSSAQHHPSDTRGGRADHTHLTGCVVVKKNY